MRSVLDVLIIGAGPVGLTMACELARHGVRFRIVDKSPAPSPTSRALAIFPRTLEVFQMMNLVDEILDSGLKVDGIVFYDKSGQIGHIGFSCLPCRYRFAVCLAQSQTERILNQHLVKLGTDVERPKELIGLLQTESNVSAAIRDAAGNIEQIEANWLVGCDGAHSGVRHALGLSFEGDAYPQNFLLADARVDSPLDRFDIHLFLAEDGILGIFPLKSERCRVIATIGDLPEGEEAKEPELAEIQTLVNRRTVQNIHLSEPIWLSRFQVSHRKIREFRLGRVFLAGDSAHIHSPAGGQGMNTGIQDAFNLGWKLGLVVHGRAPVSLLDTYNEEREPVAKMVLNLTDRLTRLATLQNPFTQQLRNALLPLLTGIHVIEDRVVETMSEIGIRYRRSSAVAGKSGHTLLAGDRAPDCCLVDGTSREDVFLLDRLKKPLHQLLFFAGHLAEDAIDFQRHSQVLGTQYAQVLETALIVSGESVANPDFIFDPDGAAHSLYETHPTGIVLVRPDGYIGFRGAGGHIDALREYLARFFQGSNLAER
ncbi:MAG: FAD-binding monooxygenase [Acidobacteria bacterium]|nr:MAG: FAD-binding monooxygenase [Acidobacteriota bacterium]